MHLYVNNFFSSLLHPFVVLIFKSFICINGRRGGAREEKTQEKSTKMSLGYARRREAHQGSTNFQNWARC